MRSSWTLASLASCRGSSVCEDRVRDGPTSGGEELQSVMIYSQDFPPGPWPPVAGPPRTRSSHGEMGLEGFDAIELGGGLPSDDAFFFFTLVQVLEGP